MYDGHTGCVYHTLGFAAGGSNTQCMMDTLGVSVKTDNPHFGLPLITRCANSISGFAAGGSKAQCMMDTPGVSIIHWAWLRAAATPIV